MRPIIVKGWQAVKGSGAIDKQSGLLYTIA